jgi:hypothetical protein
MQFLWGAICGVLLTVIATFIADTFTTSNEPVGSPQTIVNWDLLGKRVSASVDTIREEVHELTR